MESKHLAMLKDIRRMVDESGVEQFLDPYPFRSRADHMYRSYCWAKRILPCRPDADAELTLVATLFHDIGVIRATPERLKEGHDLLGADIACDYLVHHGYSAAFADTAAALIAGHQQRDLLQTGQTTIEHIILMEADMLDERGALGIVWDAMAEGSKTDQSYLWTLERFKTRKLYRRPERNPMYTELARAFWAEKQNLHMNFVLALERDLGLTDN